MIIGLISDTHNKLPRRAIEVLQCAELILHAGDIGEAYILGKLNQLAPTRAVYGNTDMYGLAQELPARLFLNLEGIEFLLIHNIGNKRDFVWKIKRGDFRPEPQVIVHGHTHRPEYETYQNYLFINPGSASQPRHGYPTSVALLEIAQGKVEDFELVEI